jgi:mitochondrial inner membrane protease subunit 2
MAPTLSPYWNERGEKDWVLIQPLTSARLASAFRPGVNKAEEPSRLEQQRGQGGHKRVARGQDGRGQINRGDIVTFWKGHVPEEISIKRAVGVEGDVVFPKRGYALDHAITTARSPSINRTDGLPTEEERELSLDRKVGGGPKKVEGRVVVPKGHIWVEGDNWRHSYDSRDFGPVSLNLVDGKAVKVWRGKHFYFGGVLFGWQSIGDGREKKAKEKASRIIEGGGHRHEEGLPEWLVDA